MVVQHNLTAMNSNRMLGITTKSQSKSTERLSSGYKINRAADDAAGLAISEKMRKQIRGLTQASANAQDGISSVQTAEGALTEVHDMLQRMNELAVKAANSTQSEDDRSYIQSEVDQLVTEIDRVATTTKFNETYLLKGTDTNGEIAKLNYSTAQTNFTAKQVGTIDAKTGKVKADFTNNNGTSSVTIGGTTYTYSATNAAANGTTSFNNMSELLSKVKSNLMTDGTVGKDIKNVELTNKADGTQQIVVSAFADLNNGLDMSLHVGADSADENKITLNINMMSARGLGVNGLRVDGANDTNATAAIDTIAAAVKVVSSQRSALGAIQNRLEHTINNLDNVVENTTSAEAAIRDTDMAEEMVKYSNNNILAQAGQAMLAQANQSNQGVLSLLG